MTIKLYSQISERNCVKKTLGDPVLDLTGTLRNESSLIDPVILIEADAAALAAVNYMYIDSFSRYYFVRGIKSIREGLVEISGHVDVLQTFWPQIKTNTAIIRRQSQLWNLNINDGVLRAQADSIVETFEFPYGFSASSFILAVAGRQDVGP